MRSSPNIDAGQTIQVTDNGQDDDSPRVSETGEDIVWQGYDDSRGTRGDLDIFRYQMSSGGSMNVSANAYLNDGNPRIVGSHVVWETERLGGEWEIMHYELGTDAIPQNVSSDPASEDRYPLVTEDLVVWRSYDGDVYRLMLARQADPEAVIPIPLVVKGDADVEPDQTFELVLDSVEVVGLVADVEVTDERATIFIINDDTGLDFGDAPATYSTLRADGGARHRIYDDAGFLAPRLGQYVDPEADGQPHSSALGDDYDIYPQDDEDGIWWDRVAPGYDANFNVAVTGSGYLSAWIDFNQDGVWADYLDSDGNLIVEKIIDRQYVDDVNPNPLVPDTIISVPISAELDAMATFARFRFSSDPAGVVDPTTPGDLDPEDVPDGEVEDYRIQVEVGDATIGGFKFYDADADGLWDKEPAHSGVAPVIAPYSPGAGVLMSGYDSDFVWYNNVSANDNLSSGPISLGFDFEFYGQTYDEFYINNNGNITFLAPSSTLPGPGGFPQIYPMIAPFWADVDTRNFGGNVHLASGTSPRGNPFVQIDWVNVGYNDHRSLTNADTRNSFVLYIEDDPGGDIVVFHYHDMQWTTGDTGGGSGGFGGNGAEIGFDSGMFGEYYSMARPQSQADLDALETQYGFRFEPSTGWPLGIEPGLAGVTIYLDVDGDGTIDHSTVTREDDPATTAIDETGYYEFTRLFDGVYRVTEEDQDPLDSIQTGPSQTLFLAGGSLDIQAVAGSALTDRRTFSIGDGANTVLFEFDNNGFLSNAGAVRVPFGSTNSAATVATAIAKAVNDTTGTTFRVSAGAIGPMVTLTGAEIVYQPGVLPQPDATYSVPVNRATGQPGYYVVKLRPSENLQNADFGNYRLPHITVSDVKVLEGNTGIAPTTKVDVTIQLTDSFGAPITLDFETLPISAIEGDLHGASPVPYNADYHGVAGTVTIPPHGTPLEEWTLRTITSNRANDYDYQVSRDSVIWESHDGSDWEIYLYDASLDVYEQLTDNSTDDKLARHYKFQDPGTGEWLTHIVWAGIPDPDEAPEIIWVGTGSPDFGSDYEIFLDVYHHNSLSHERYRLTSNNYDDKGPFVSDTHVVWWANTPTDKDVYLYDITTLDDPVRGLPVDISKNNYDDYDPRISGANIAWYGSDGADLEVYLYVADPGNVAVPGARVQLTNDSLKQNSVQIDGNNVVWVANDTVDNEIFVHQFDPLTLTGATYQVTDNTSDDIRPRISGENIVWQGLQGTNWEIFLSTVSGAALGVAPVNISNSPLRDENPRVASDQAVWHTWDGDDWEVYHYEFGGDRIPLNLSDNEDFDWYPQISDEMMAWRYYDDEDYEIIIATQADPVITYTITLEINGDLTFEPDETFLFQVTGAVVDSLGLNVFDHVDDPEAVVEILNDDGDMDYGDAPDDPLNPNDYPTLLASNGARHLYVKDSLQLGAELDSEPDGLPNAAATGDDVIGRDDEDGVVFHGSPVPGEQNNLITVTVTDLSSAKDGYLNGWMDFNGDGDWADDGEQLVFQVWNTFTGQPVGLESKSIELTHGPNTLRFAVPSSARLGETYARFRLSSEPNLDYTGTAPDGEVEDYRVTIAAAGTQSVTQTGRTVTVLGTDGDDILNFIGSPSGGEYKVLVNGRNYSFAADEVDKVSFDGGAGTDAVFMLGTAGDETTRLWPHNGVLTGAGFTVNVAGAESVAVHGGGGKDVALLFDDPAAPNTFEAGPDSATFSGDGFENSAVSFRYVHAYGTEGNGDLAVLNDVPGGKDTFQGFPTYARLYGDGYYNRAIGFDRVEAYSTPGDRDVALLYDDPAVPNTFEAWPHEATFSGAGFDNRAFSFRYVHGCATLGGGDKAVLHDAAATQDRFEAWPLVARLYGKGFYTRVLSFSDVQATATPRGNDVAVLRDDPKTADWLYAHPHQVRFTGGAFQYQADSFRYVYAYATDGGGDVALLYNDPRSADVFQAWPEIAIRSASDFYNRVQLFDYVHAYSAPGERDVAVLHDDPATVDTFEAWPEMARLYHRKAEGGYSFYNRVNLFDYVHSFATAGGNDEAYLYGSDADDTFEAWPEKAQLYQWKSGEGYSFYNRVNSFRYVNAYGLDGNDRAVLYDSALEADYLQAQDNWARMYSDLYSYLVTDFGQVEANSSNDSDSEDVDPDAIDFILQMNGGW